MSEQTLKNEVNISVENGVGIITLNRVKAINALTPGMITTISNALAEWSLAPEVRMVLMEGAGEKGFCAGGDVRWTRGQIIAGNGGKVENFFASEYKMNLMISTFAKPIVALTHGVVMGGGIGLAGHARYRITTEEARFAMPEAAIGLFCDVGVRSLLAKVERHRALMFMFSANMVGAADAIELGLTDVTIAGDRFNRVRAALIQAGAAIDVEREIGKIITANQTDAGTAIFCELADRFADIFAGDDCAIIYERLENRAQGVDEMAQMAKLILGRCPTSNAVHLVGQDAAIEQPQIEKVLQTDLALAKYLGTRSDFLEGVRAVLVDKDQNPKWQPDSIGQVDIEAILSALDEKSTI